ncbi:protein of unknown function [Methylocella tundrae]|uniref:Uncharacterized protein n=1 Tax=Methylocella tundrae TaxID=227605 RepID=A0A4U8YV87_METTU|nr:protein of unknown function [Methylocella tundrae]
MSEILENFISFLQLHNGSAFHASKTHGIALTERGDPHRRGS